MRFAILLVTVSLCAQETPLTPREKDFQQMLDGSMLIGSFTRQGRPGTSEDKYTVERVTKVKEGLWRIEARVQYGGRDVKFPFEIPVKWADDDTPVMTLTDYMIPGMGAYSARILFYKNQYAGAWSAAKGGSGLMFGRVVKESKPSQ